MFFLFFFGGEGRLRCVSVITNHPCLLLQTNQIDKRSKHFRFRCKHWKSNICKIVIAKVLIFDIESTIQFYIKYRITYKQRAVKVVRTYTCLIIMEINTQKLGALLKSCYVAHMQILFSICGIIMQIKILWYLNIFFFKAADFKHVQLLTNKKYKIIQYHYDEYHI